MSITGPKPGSGVPTVRLSISYFFYFSIMGGLIPYLGRFLRSQGFDFAQISQTAAILTMAMAVGPFLWAALSDRTGKRMLWSRVSAFIMVLSALLMAITSQPVGLIACIALFGLFLSSVVPQLEAVTLEYLGPGSTRYGNIRLWGTLGFAVVVVILGPALAFTGAQVLPWWMAALALATLISFSFLSDVPYASDRPREAAHWGNFFFRLRRPPVWGLYLILLLWNVSLAAYNTFFDLYLQDVGYSSAAIG
ncbi:MAG: MFS transporter, partial [Natronospirillum sp.]